MTYETRVISLGPTLIYAVISMSVVNWSDVHTRAGQVVNINTPFLQNVALKIALSNANLTFSFSVDGGASYDPVLTESVTSFFPSASGLKAVWMVNNNYSGGLSSMTLADWKVR